MTLCPGPVALNPLGYQPGVKAQSYGSFTSSEREQQSRRASSSRASSSRVISNRADPEQVFPALAELICRAIPESSGGDRSGRLTTRENVQRHVLVLRLSVGVVELLVYVLVYNCAGAPVVVNYANFTVAFFDEANMI